MSNTHLKKTTAQQAWRRLRDRDIAAALSDRKNRAARGITTQSQELRAGRVSSTNTTPDPAQNASNTPLGKDKFLAALTMKD